jgi:hypothetical protein
MFPWNLVSITSCGDNVILVSVLPSYIENVWDQGVEEKILKMRNAYRILV